MKFARGCFAAGLLTVSLGLAGTVLAGDDIPLRDWSVPSARTLAPLADVGNPVAFQAMTPCRVVDTRGATGAYGGPGLSANVSRAFNIPGGPCTGIPSGATAYSLNFTVLASAGVYTGAYLSAWATGGTQPVVSTLNFAGGQVVANAAIVPAGSNSITVIANAATNLLIDINGYYTNSPSYDNQFFITGYFPSAAAIVGFNYSVGSGSHGVGGYAGGASLVHGVQGQIADVATAGSSGVHGINGNATARTFAVYGESASTVSDGAAILGRVTGGTPPTISGNATSAAGVRGEAQNRGVVGIAGPSGVGVRGFSVDAAGGLQQWGSLGMGTTYGVWADGNMGASGTKPFVEPHPTDSTKVIRYVALEGNEAGTYFRGTAVSSRGVAVIEVPESFRMVTAEDGLTVQVTTVGSAARAWVESEGLDRIVIRTSADTRFHYLVQGVRRAYADWQVIAEGNEYRPESPTQKMPAYLSQDVKQRLIANGTYNPDGTVNMTTAERNGWVRQWKQEAGQKDQ